MELAEPDVWEDHERAQRLGQEQVRLNKLVSSVLYIASSLDEIHEWLKLYYEDSSLVQLEDLIVQVEAIKSRVEALEFQRMFGAPNSVNNAYLDIQSGSGGTEAQDWAEMLQRMYARFSEKRGFKVDVIEETHGDVAGLKSTTLHISGEYAFGWLRTETGVHRLVRKSPFDAANKRHTSFSSVFVYPEIDDNIEIDINPADLRIDTYRASGAGGQHVNRTDSAVRITHLPTNTVVQCQADRSQHKNKASAMSQLRAKLYEIELLKKQEVKQALEETKSEIGWGQQIRSYVLDQSRIKDLRTKIELSSTQDVLDGELEKFIVACLQQGY